MNNDKAFSYAIVGGLVGSLIGAIPITLFLVVFNLFNLISGFVFNQENSWLGVVLHLIITIFYAFPISICIYYPCVRWGIEFTKKHAFYLGLTWGIVTWLLSVMVLPVIIDSSGLFYHFDFNLLFSSTYINIMAISFIAHMIYGVVSVLIAKMIFTLLQSRGN